MRLPYVRMLGCLILCMLSGMGSAKTQVLYPLPNAVQSARFQRVVQQLRCLVCPNENLSDSEAGFAADLRAVIYSEVKRGDTAEQIIQHMVADYGELIRYKPTLAPTTYVLWFAPFVLLLMGVCVVGWVVCRHGKGGQA